MADNSLLLAKYIQQILEESEEIKAIIGEDTHKIFTVLQPDKLSFPYIVHGRSGISVEYTKDIEYGNIGWYNTVTYNVYSVSDDYEQCLDLANAIRHSLETYRWKTEEIYIHPIQLLTVSEYTTEEDAFVEELQFQCVVE